jgi:hypothetical protein
MRKTTVLLPSVTDSYGPENQIGSNYFKELKKKKRRVWWFLIIFIVETGGKFLA